MLLVRIQNTLSGKAEEFFPLDGKKVKMYVCGITPYDKSHLGHARTLVSFDIIRRWLMHRGYQVSYAQNITDIDDKIIRRAKEKGMLPLELAGKYGAEAEEEFSALGIMKPDFSPKVSEYIPQIIALIGKIEKNGYAYRTESGIYFDVMKFKGYGKLSGQAPKAMLAGARVEVDEKKKNPQDFALWKFGKETGAAFESPWGEGRPGWHIECSAMATSLLGDTIDVHGGARDLVFPHHENEIAQSEAATGKPFVRHFIHTGFLTVNGEKMSKSLGNFITIEKGLSEFPAQDIRMLFALAHYRSPMDFTEEAAVAAGNSLRTLHSAISASRSYSSGAKGDGRLAKEAAEAKRRFEACMDDDFDTPNALSALFMLAKRLSGACSEGSAGVSEVKEAGETLSSLLSVLNLAPQEKKNDGAAAIAALCEEFGVLAGESEKESVENLIALRDDARGKRDFALSDRIRNALGSAGIVLEDRKDGTTGWRRK